VITLKRVLTQVLVLKKVVENLPPKCASLLSRATNWDSVQFLFKTRKAPCPQVTWMLWFFWIDPLLRFGELAHRQTMAP
jgi:hypothetical protein